MTLETVWFAAVVLLFAGYAVLDGFDFGAGALHLFVAKSDAERRQVLAAIGPYWDGNEVWLLAGGGALFLAFPRVLAVGLSGFYLAVFLLLWVLILRGIAIEFRSHVEDVLWRAAWDAIFASASCLAPVLLGAALGNVLRGVPLGEAGWFALPLFGSLLPSGELGVLDAYTVLVGVTALVALLHHGALFLVWKTDGPVQARARVWACRLFPTLLLVWVVASVATQWVAPEIYRGVGARWPALSLAVLALGGLVACGGLRQAGRDRAAFAASGVFVLGLLLATAAAVHPIWLKSTVDPRFSLSATNAAAGEISLRAGLVWWPIGFVLALLYLVLLLRLHRGKAHAPEAGSGY